MAFSSTLQKGQIPVGCQLCEGGSKIQWKCCDCDLLMCTKCKEKIHSKIKNSNKHRIIDIKEVVQNDSVETIAFSDFNCKQHTNNSCCLFCKTCKELVCFKCISNPHNGHNLVDEEVYDIRRMEIRDKKTRIEKNLNYLTKMKEEIRKIKKSENSKYDKSKEDILAQKKIIEKLVEELLIELEDNQKELNQDLEGKLNEVDKMKKDLQEENTTMDELIRSKDLVKFFEESDKLELSLDKNIQIDTKYSSLPEFYPREVTRSSIGTFKIEEKESKTEFSCVKDFTSYSKCIRFLATHSDGSVWKWDSKSKLIIHNQVKENKMKQLFKLTTVCDVAVTPIDDLLIIDCQSILKQVSRTGEIKDTPYCVAPLEPIAIHVASNYTVIIGAKTPGPAFPATGRRDVIIMDQTGNHLVEYELDHNNKPLFTYPARITSTSEGNIFVIDILDSDCRGRVVVLSPTGDVINTYSGHSDIYNKEPFKPSNIITTTLNNIVVVDMDKTIHILDSEGHFIFYTSAEDPEMFGFLLMIFILKPLSQTMLF